MLANCVGRTKEFAHYGLLYYKGLFVRPLTAEPLSLGVPSLANPTGAHYGIQGQSTRKGPAVFLGAMVQMTYPKHSLGAKSQPILCWVRTPY